VQDFSQQLSTEARDEGSDSDVFVQMANASMSFDFFIDMLRHAAKGTL
jgi:hypothetical protein